MATPTASYRFDPVQVIIDVKESTPPPSDSAEDEGVEVDVKEIEDEQPAEEPVMAAKEPTQEPVLEANNDQIAEKQPAEEPAREPEMNQQTNAPKTTDQRSIPTLDVREQMMPPEQEKPMTTSSKTVFNVTRRDLFIVGITLTLVGIIVALFTVRTTSTKLPPAIIVEEPASRRAIIVDGGNKPTADMGNTSTPSRTPAATAPSLNPATTSAPTNAPAAAASTTPATGQTYTYKVQTGDYVLAIMKVCDADQDEADAIKWFEENNDDVTDTDALAINQVVKVPCQIKQGKKNSVWQMRQKIARQRKAAADKIQPVKPATPPPAAPPTPPSAPVAPAAAKPATDAGVTPAAK